VAGAADGAQRVEPGAGVLTRSAYRCDVFQSYEGPATFVVENVAYPIQRLRLRVRRTSEIIETHGRRRRLVGLEGVELIILDLLEMPELPADGELRLGDGQVLPIIWTGRKFELRLNA
jgi:hypothetical protein